MSGCIISQLLCVLSVYIFELDDLLIVSHLQLTYLFRVLIDLRLVLLLLLPPFKLVVLSHLFQLSLQVLYLVVAEH